MVTQPWRPTTNRLFVFYIYILIYTRVIGSCAMGVLNHIFMDDLLYTMRQTPHWARRTSPSSKKGALKTSGQQLHSRVALDAYLAFWLAFGSYAV